MRLWQRIRDEGLFGGFTEHSDLDMAGQHRQAAGLQEAIVTQAVRFDFQNVWDHTQQIKHQQGQAGIRPVDLETFAQPFDVTWYEWRGNGIDYGALTLQVPDADTEGHRWIDAYLFYFEPSSMAALFRQPVKRALCLGFERFIVDSDTQAMTPDGWRREFYTNFGPNVRIHDQFNNVWRSIMDDVSVVFMFGLRLLHCKNVSVEEAPDIRTRQQRRYDDRRGIEPVVFKTLVIDPSMSRKATPAERRAKTDPVTRLHICRGHFSTYTEEKPLFGKYSGTFWIPAHVRGSAEVGEVRKDYRVKAGAAA